MDVFKTFGKSNVIYGILRKIDENGLHVSKQSPCRPRESASREDRWICNLLKKDCVRATAICKRANAQLGIKISRHTIARRLNEIYLNSLVTFMKPYFSKKNKMS